MILQLVPKNSMRQFDQIIFFCSGLVFLFFYPILQLVCFYVAIGGDPKLLQLGVVSDELKNLSMCRNTSLITVHKHDYECDW